MRIAHTEQIRRAYITALLRNGNDLRTVQAYAGHKDMARTMGYPYLDFETCGATRFQPAWPAWHCFSER